MNCPGVVCSLDSEGKLDWNGMAFLMRTYIRSRRAVRTYVRTRERRESGVGDMSLLTIHTHTKKKVSQLLVRDF